MPTDPITLRWRNAKHNLSASRLHLKRAIAHVVAAELLEAKEAKDGYVDTFMSTHLRQLLDMVNSEYADIVEVYEKSTNSR